MEEEQEAIAEAERVAAEQAAKAVREYRAAESPEA